MRGDGRAAGRMSDRPAIMGGIDNEDRFANLRAGSRPVLAEPAHSRSLIEVIEGVL
jgi:hypothetical protein